MRATFDSVVTKYYRGCQCVSQEGRGYADLLVSSFPDITVVGGGPEDDIAMLHPSTMSRPPYDDSSEVSAIDPRIARL